MHHVACSTIDSVEASPSFTRIIVVADIMNHSNDVSTTRSGLLRRLQQRTTPIRVSMAGAGAMGKGLFYQIAQTPGVACVALADLDIDRCIETVEMTGQPYAVVETERELEQALDRGLVAIATDANLIARAPNADVFVESTNAIAEGARFCLTAIHHGCHVVMMNAEADLLFGPYLMQEAHRNDLVYTSCDGDQHGVLARLIDEIELWGFELVLAGNIKGYLDRYANPTSIIPEADKRNLDYEMCTAYTDGTKLSIEMALLANALDLRADVTGMHGPRAADVHEALDLFDLDDLRSRPRPAVDYILGAQPGGGVFAIGFGDEPYQRDMMKYYKMGVGPYYVFYRPYHLCHVEAIRSIVEPVLDGVSLLEPAHGMKTNVFAYAKKDLRAGDTLDGIGGYATYGQICNLEKAGNALPIGLADAMKLTTDVAQDEPLSFADVSFDKARRDIQWYELARGRSGANRVLSSAPAT